eukprot:333398-Rhodomonas_salina.1
MEDSASASQKGRYPALTWHGETSDTSSVLSPRLYSNPTAGFGRGVSLTTPDMEPGPHLSSPRFGEPGLLRKVPVAAPGQWMDGAQFMQLNSPRSRSAPSSASLPAMPHSDMAYAVLQIEPRSQRIPHRSEHHWHSQVSAAALRTRCAVRYSLGRGAWYYQGPVDGHA